MVVDCREAALTRKSSGAGAVRVVAVRDGVARAGAGFGQEAAGPAVPRAGAADINIII